GRYLRSCQKTSKTPSEKDNSQATRTEEPSGTDPSPNQRSSSKSIRRRTNKPILLPRRAYIHNMRPHRLLHTRHHKTAHKRRTRLGSKHHPRRDLHVMSQLEIAREQNRLSGPNVRDRFEDHVCDRPTGEHEPRDHLVHDVERELLVRDGLDHGK